MSTPSYDEWEKFKKSFIALQKSIEAQEPKKTVDSVSLKNVMEAKSKNNSAKSPKDVKYEALEKKISEMEEELMRQKRIIHDLVNVSLRTKKEEKRINMEDVMKQFNQDKAYWCLTPCDIPWERIGVDAYKGLI